MYLGGSLYNTAGANHPEKCCRNSRVFENDVNVGLDIQLCVCPVHSIKNTWKSFTDRATTQVCGGQAFDSCLLSLR
jgi:hypothetical protein